MTSVLVLNGPNLNLLGTTRKPEVYGSTSLADVERMCQSKADELDLELVFRQSNHEGQLIDWIHEFGAAAKAGNSIGADNPEGAHPHPSRCTTPFPPPLLHLPGRPRDRRRLRRPRLRPGAQRALSAVAAAELT